MTKPTTNEPGSPILLSYEPDLHELSVAAIPLAIRQSVLPALNRTAVREHLRIVDRDRSTSASLEELRRLSLDVNTPEDVLLELCDRGLCIDEMGHRSAPRKLIERIANKYQYPEAVLTVAKRLYTDWSETSIEFEAFLKSHVSNEWMVETLAREEASDEIKQDIFLAAIDEHPQKHRLSEIYQSAKRERAAKRENRPTELARLYATNDPRVLLALATNRFTPQSILQELATRHSGRLARQIRSAALDTMSEM